MESENSEVFEGSHSNNRLANYLRDATKTTVKKYLGHFQFRVFKECYPELVQYNRKHFKVFHQNLLDELGKSIAEDLSQLYKEEGVFQSLRKLDEVISAQKNRIEGWTPSGNPEEDLRDHIHQEKLIHKQRLSKAYQDMKDETEQLYQMMSENHNAIMGYRKEIHNMNSEMNRVFLSKYDEKFCLSKSIM